MAHRVLVAGASGRMGQTLVRLILQDASLQLVGGTVRPGSAAVGSDLGSSVGVAVRLHMTDNLELALAEGKPDVVIDFSAPAATVATARVCAEAHIPMVIGTTGFAPDERVEIAGASAKAPIVLAPNMSVGVNVLVAAAKQVAKTLGNAFDVEIVESHHRMKRDAPSGTALQLADAVALELGRTRADYRMAREGHVGARTESEIGIQSLRGGDVVGDHTVFFLGPGERIELTHRATNRDQFALGALRAAKWLVGRAPGLFTMQDVLGL
jgi:4-hydroxy-tetrahydrodipicolinate reductase